VHANNAQAIGLKGDVLFDARKLRVTVRCVYMYIYREGSLDNSYLDNLDNEYLNKYEKKSYDYVLLLID
jgi:hypothetical protein